MTTQDSNQQHKSGRFVQAYNQMLERVRHGLDGLAKDTTGEESAFHRVLSNAVEKAVELGELTREEADRIADYLVRDLKDASRFMADTGEEFRNWLRFDVDLVEDRMLDLFSRIADKTRLQQLFLFRDLERMSEYHTGEITGIGTLRCRQCGELLHFHHTGRIPPCPKCHATLYSRVEDETSSGDSE